MTDEDIKTLGCTTMRVDGPLRRCAHRTLREEDPVLYASLTDGERGDGTARIVKYLVRRGLESLKGEAG